MVGASCGTLLTGNQCVNRAPGISRSQSEIRSTILKISHFACRRPLAQHAEATSRASRRNIQILCVCAIGSWHNTLHLDCTHPPLAFHPLAMPVEIRQRYNAKARQSTVGGSSHKKKGKRKTQQPLSQDAPEVNPNAEIVAPKSEEQKEQDRREKLREEVRRTRAQFNAVRCLIPRAASSTTELEI